MLKYLYSFPGLSPLYNYLKLEQYYRSHQYYDFPFAPSQKSRIETMVEFADIKPGVKSLDLGAGDGKVVIAFTEAGADAYGIEINPVLLDLANFNFHRYYPSKESPVKLGNLWHEPLQSYDIITLYGLGSTMARLEDRLAKEAKKGCRIISNRFSFPHWKPVKEKDHVLLYIK